MTIGQKISFFLGKKNKLEYELYCQLHDNNILLLSQGGLRI